MKLRQLVESKTVLESLLKNQLPINIAWELRTFVKVLNPEYINLFTQKPKIKTLLPVTFTELESEEKSNGFYLFEPNKKILLDSLLKHYLEMTVYHQFIESFLSEQAARMMSMQNATTNAQDIVTDLQLEYNRTRQAKITSELLDITGGSSIATYE